MAIESISYLNEWETADSSRSDLNEKERGKLMLNVTGWLVLPYTSKLA